MKYNFLLKILTVLFVIREMCIPVSAQKIEKSSLKIIDDKPSVYISFHHSGKQNPLFEGENSERIWLNLHNNTKLKIFLCVFDVDKEYGQQGIFYDVEKSSFSAEYKNVKVPLGYGKADDCEVFTLFPKKSLLFSLPATTLQKDYLSKRNFILGGQEIGKKTCLKEQPVLLFSEIAVCL